MTTETYDHRFGIVLSRKLVSREGFKRMHKNFITNPIMKNNYTGYFGRQMCFQFKTEKEKDDFKKMINEKINQKKFL